MPSRRTLLAASTAALAGCLGSPGGLTDRPASGSRTDRPASDGATDDCHSGYFVTADPYDPAGELPVDPGDAARSLVATAADEGAAEVTTYAGTPPVRSGVYVEHDGTYYRTAVDETATTTVPARLTDVEWEKGVTPTADAVAYEDLPATDRRALEYAVYGPEYGRERGGHPTEGLSVRDSPVPYPDGAADSRLAGAGETWVRWNGRAYRVTVGGEATTTRHTYRVALDAVADGAAGFRGHVAAEYLVRLDDLFADERAVVEAAINGGYEECEPASAALSGLGERLPDDRTLPPPDAGSWFVAYDGRRYGFEVTNWVH